MMSSHRPLRVLKPTELNSSIAISLRDAAVSIFAQVVAPLRQLDALAPTHEFVIRCRPRNLTPQIYHSVKKHSWEAL